MDPVEASVYENCAAYVVGALGDWAQTGRVVIYQLLGASVCSISKETVQQLAGILVCAAMQTMFFQIQIQILYSPNFTTRKMSRKRYAYKHKQTTTLTYIN